MNHKPVVDHRIYTIRPRGMPEFIEVFDRLAMPILLESIWARRWASIPAALAH